MSVGVAIFDLRRCSASAIVIEPGERKFRRTCSFAAGRVLTQIFTIYIIQNHKQTLPPLFFPWFNAGYQPARYTSSQHERAIYYRRQRLRSRADNACKCALPMAVEDNA